MGRRLIDVTDTYIDTYLDEDEFVVGIDFTPDIVPQGLSNVTTVTFYISNTSMDVPAASADVLYVFTDSTATAAVTITYNTAAGYIPFPVVGKLCGPTRLIGVLDTAAVTATQVAVITSKG